MILVPSDGLLQSLYSNLKGEVNERISHFSECFSATPNSTPGNKLLIFNKPHDPISFDNNSETIIHLRCYLTFETN